MKKMYNCIREKSKKRYKVGHMKLKKAPINYRSDNQYIIHPLSHLLFPMHQFDTIAVHTYS